MPESPHNTDHLHKGRRAVWAISICGATLTLVLVVLLLRAGMGGASAADWLFFVFLLGWMIAPYVPFPWIARYLRSPASLKSLAVGVGLVGFMGIASLWSVLSAVIDGQVGVATPVVFMPVIQGHVVIVAIIVALVLNSRAK